MSFIFSEYFCIDCGQNSSITKEIPESCPDCNYSKLAYIVNVECDCGYTREISISKPNELDNFEYKCLVCKSEANGITKRYREDVEFWQAWRDIVWQNTPTGIMPRYVPSIRQLDFHDAPEPKRIFIAGNRFGKSLAGAKEILPLILLPRKNIGLVASEMSLTDPELNYVLEDLNYFCLHNLFGMTDSTIEAKLKKNYYIIKHGAKSNWSYIYYDSTAKKIALEGKEFDLIVPCEAAHPQFKTNWLVQYMGPRLSSRKGVWFMLMTPCERGEFYVWLQNQKSRKDVYYRDEVHSLESPFSYPEFLNDMKDTMPEHFYNERFGGQWQSYGGLIMNEFRPQKNIIYDVNNLPDDLRLFGGIDFGPIDPNVLLVIGHSKSENAYYCLNELFIPRISIQEFAIQCIKFLNELGLNHSNIPLYGDTAKEGYLRQFREAGFKNITPAPKALLREYDYYMESLHQVNGLFKINKLFICSGLRELLLCINNYSWNSVTQKPKHEFSHGPDALRYAIFGDMFSRGFSPKQVFELYKRIAEQTIPEQEEPIRPTESIKPRMLTAKEKQVKRKKSIKSIYSYLFNKKNNFMN